MHLISFLICTLAVISCPAQQTSSDQQSNSDQHSVSDQLMLTTDSVGPRRFVAVHGRRSAIMGYPETGLEVWAYPFQILSNYQIGFLPQGATTASDGRRFLRRIIYRPEAITRIYIGSDYIVRETLFTPLDEPGAILRYEVEGKPVDIQIHFTPVLNLMWPGAIGGQFAEWNSDLPGYVLSEPTQEFSASIASSEIVAHDTTVNSALRTATGVLFSIRPEAKVSGAPAAATIYVALEPEHSKDSSAAVRSLSSHRDDMETQAVKHYAELQQTALRIRTPDEDVNRALEWAEVALDQAWVCNPQLGCGIVAGYGPSRDARRPQYDWFFAGDGLVAANALLSAGEYSRAREELQFIVKYQDPKTGMIWHELSQSAGLIDWKKYPYMYVHVDISFDYLNTVARYVELSGDTAFASDHWSSIAAAYKYCQTVIQASDHLPHIPADKEGGDEQDRPDDDLSLSSSWVAATNSFAELAAVAAHPELVDDASKANQLARVAIATRYWDSEHQFWIEGHTRSGKPIFGWRKGPGQAIVQNIFSPEENDELLNEIASSDFQTDWGTRSVAARSAIYDPDSYGKGSVWALGTSETAATFWQEHRPTIAYAIWSALRRWNALDSLGHLHEVLAGNYYHEETESVPEQTWSSAGLLDAAVVGLLGLDVQGAQNTVVFAPHLPADWDHTSIENIRLPRSTLAFTLSQDMNEIDLYIRNDGAPVKVMFEPQIPIGADGIEAKCEDRSVPAHPELFPEDEHVKVEIGAQSGTTHCYVRFAGGVSVFTKQPALQLGDTSTAIKITNIRLQNHNLLINADVNASGNSIFFIQTQWKIVKAEGASVSPLSNHCYEVMMQTSSASTNSPGFVRSHAEIELGEK